MKKIIYSTSLLFIFCNLNALPVGNPMDPMLFKTGIFWPGRVIDHCDEDEDDCDDTEECDKTDECNDDKKCDATESCGKTDECTDGDDDKCADTEECNKGDACDDEEEDDECDDKDTKNSKRKLKNYYIERTNDFWGCSGIDPAILSLRFGYWGYFCFDHKMKLQDGPNIDNFEIFTNAGMLIFNINNRIDIYGAIGNSSIYFDSNIATFGFIGSGRLELQTDSSTSYSAGVRITLWEYEDTAIGLDARYFRTNPDIRRITVLASTSVFPDERIDITYREWQFGLSIAKKVKMFVPYFAIKWGDSDVSFDDAVVTLLGTPFALTDIRNREHWGVALGVTLVDCCNMTLNAEAQLRDEKSLSVNAQIRF